MKLECYAKRGVLVLFLLIFLSIPILVPAEENVGAVEGFRSEHQITQILDTSISGGATVDLNEPMFKNNVELVKKIFREKYNLNINSFVGAKVISGNLILPGGTSINLKTGKTLTIDAVGATINSFTDGDMVVVNAIDMNYDGTNLKVQRGQRVFYENTESTNVRNFVGEQSTLSLVSADLIISEGGNLLSKVSNVVIKKSPSSSSFSFVCAGADQSNVGGIKINCLNNKKVTANTGVKGASITLDKDITFQHNNLEGKADEDNAQFSYQEIGPNNEQIITSLATLKIQFGGKQQTIIAKTEIKFKLDENEGVYDLSLGAESRFSHQEPEETKSYYLLNPGPAPYTTSIITPSHQMSVDSAIALYNGFIDRSQNYFQLNGIVTFGVYANMLPYDIFESKHHDNRITIDAAQLSLSTDIRCAEGGVFFSLHNGDFNIVEACNNQPERYADFEHKDTPLFLTKYTINYDHAEISFANGVLKQSKNGNFFTMYPRSSIPLFSELMQKYNERFAQCNQFEEMKE